MAISFDAVADRNSAAGATTISWSHTTGASADFIIGSGNCFDGTDADRALSSSTFNGDAMTLANTYNDDTLNMTSHLVYRIAPDIGTFTFSLTFAGAVGSPCGGTTSLIGVKQTSPIGAVNGESNVDTQNINIPLTTTAENSWLYDDFISTQNTNGVEATSSQDTRWAFALSGGRKHGGSTKVATSITEYTMDLDFGATTAYNLHTII